MFHHILRILRWQSQLISIFGGMFGLGCISLLSLFSFAHYDYYCNLLQLLLLLPLSIILRDIAVTIIIIGSYFYFYWQYNENIWHTIWLFNIAMERSTIFKFGKPSINGSSIPWLCKITRGYMGMDQYLLITFLGGWTSIYQLFWCSPGVQGFDPSPYDIFFSSPRRQVWWLS